MKALTPRDLPGLFLEGFNSGDVESVVALYEAEGVVAADPANPVAGQAAIMSMVSDFLAQGPRFSLESSEVVEAGDLALIRSQWTMTLAGGEESSTARVAPALVARRQPEGHWLVVIDRPLFAD